MSGRNGKTVQVIRTVAADWMSLALALHFEGADILRIQLSTHHQPQSATIQVLQEWLEGRGRKPVNWSTLIAALEASGHNELAKDLMEALLE